MTAAAQPAPAPTTYVLAAPPDTRCGTGNCGGYAHARIVVTVTTQAVWDLMLDDESTVELALCRRCIASLAAGNDLEVEYLTEVSP